MQIEPEKQPYSLPKDIEFFETELQAAHHDIKKLIRVSDGLFFGIGMDALLGIIPGVGEIYTFFASSWMFALAMRVKTPVGDMLTFILLTLIDMSFGIIPTVGDIIDAFVRIHSWFGNQLLENINFKLKAISHARVLANNGEYQDLDVLKESLLK